MQAVSIHRDKRAELGIVAQTHKRAELGIVAQTHKRAELGIVRHRSTHTKPAVFFEGPEPPESNLHLRCSTF